MQVKIIQSILILLLLLTATDIYSQQKRMRNRNGTPSSFKYLDGFYFTEYSSMKIDLQLTDKQINDVSETNKIYGSKLDENNKKLIPLKKELQILLLSQEVNLDKVKSKLREISDIDIEIQMTKIRHRLAIEKIFNSNQMNKLTNEKKWILRHTDD